MKGTEESPDRAETQRDGDTWLRGITLRIISNVKILVKT